MILFSAARLDLKFECERHIYLDDKKIIFCLILCRNCDVVSILTNILHDLNVSAATELKIVRKCLQCLKDDIGSK